jgi:DinB superfamily
MRKRVLAVAFVVAFGAILTAAPPITALERQRLVAHMQMIASWLEDEVSGLSAAQSTFRPSATSWTILEVLDHLVVVGPIYWKDLQNAKPVAGRAGMMNDIDVLWYGIDRTARETALKTEEPSRTLRDVQSGVTAYRTQHAKLLEHVRTTTDDLRSRLVERQNSDAYQWALLISTHEQRHILQIREIKAHPKYPKR